MNVFSSDYFNVIVSMDIRERSVKTRRYGGNCPGDLFGIFLLPFGFKRRITVVKPATKTQREEVAVSTPHMPVTRLTG